jgi:hypothetical protein
MSLGESQLFSENTATEEEEDVQRGDAKDMLRWRDAGLQMGTVI